MAVKAVSNVVQEMQTRYLFAFEFIIRVFMHFNLRVIEPAL